MHEALSQLATTLEQSAQGSNFQFPTRWATLTTWRRPSSGYQSPQRISTLNSNRRWKRQSIRGTARLSEKQAAWLDAGRRIAESVTDPDATARLVAELETGTSLADQIDLTTSRSVRFKVRLMRSLQKPVLSSARSLLVFASPKRLASRSL